MNFTRAWLFGENTLENESTYQRLHITEYVLEHFC